MAEIEALSQMQYVESGLDSDMVLIDDESQGYFEQITKHKTIVDKEQRYNSIAFVRTQTHTITSFLLYAYWKNMRPLIDIPHSSQGSL